MATDIADKHLKTLRNNRWEKAFSQEAKAEQCPMPDDAKESVNRKATIVIEHLIQASDISHTMQHWHVYLKWNRRFFLETYKAYSAGRSDKNPIEYWYEGEIGFFDFYIIPLARKLKECGVFGVSSGEYLQFALENRKEWLAQGRTVVAEMAETVTDSQLHQPAMLKSSSLGTVIESNKTQERVDDEPSLL